MLSFTLDRNFVNQYRERPEPFGFGALGALTFYRTYSRIKDNGKYESWADACERVINGMYSIQADYCSENGIPFNRDKAMASAREAFDRLFNFKWSPPGRGLSHMGANSVHERGMYEAVQNCSFISTESIAQHRGALFSWMMEMLMLGVGVGSDVRGAGRVNVVAPSADAGVTRYIVPDSREGWAESLATLVNSYLPTGYGRMPVVEFDYSLVRPAGTLIKGFGGVACLTGDTTVYFDNPKRSTEQNKISISELYEMYASSGDSSWKWESRNVRLRSLDENTGGFFANKVVGVYDNGISDVYIVTTENGYTIKATDNHRFINSAGEYQELKLFSIGEEIAVNGTQEKKTGICVDCGAAITRRAKRCKACFDFGQIKDDALETTARQRAQCRSYLVGHPTCEKCGEDNQVQVHHIDRNPLNNSHDNLETLCSHCHTNLHAREDSFGNAYKHRYISYDKIVSIEYAGREQVYDIEMVAPFHNFVANGFVSHNSGPEPLAWMHEKVRSILDENCESAITTKTLADIINMIGVVVVAGNVRRCIHGDEIVYTESGACAIKDIKPGDMVLVSDGTYMPVVDKFNNGVSELLEIQTDVSSIRVTPDHKLAVVDSINSYKWVQARDIKEGDRVVVVPSFGGKNSNGLNENLAWIIGYFMGDGNVYRNSVSFAMSDARLDGELGKKLVSVIESEFGYSAKIVRSSGGYAHVRIYDELIAGWFLQFKNPKEMPSVPVWIFGATPSVRGAFLAGLADADGSSSHSALVYSIYPEFLKKVQQIAASIGVYTKYSSVPSKMLPGRDKVYAGAHYVSIVGLSSKDYARKYISPHAARWSLEETYKTKSGPAYLASCNSGKIGSSYAPRSTRNGEKTISYDWVDSAGFAPSWIPCRVNSIIEVSPSETFDIEVSGKHEFVCNSILSHNSSEILLGHKNDKQFSDLKNPNVFPDRNSMTGGWSWASNNTILANVGMDYSPYLDNIMLNGEPGFLWLENVNNYARMNGVVDTRDMADGTNPCSEQLLYGYSPAGLGGEMCTLCEVYLPHHTDKYDFYRSIKFAYLYGKTITLLSDKMRHPGTRDLMTRNRRIGLSLTGIAQFVGANGAHKAIDWMDNGYKYVQHYDHRYSDWFGVNRSLRTTSVKPSGTVSLVAGVTPGVHYPHSIHYIRRVRLAESSHLVSKLEAAGIHIEPSATSSSTVVASFPVFSGGNLRPVSKVSIWEQFQMAAMAQRYWSDNSVSVTISVNPNTTTKDDVLHCLDHFQHSLKSVSLLPLVDGGAYAQMPYEEISESQYQEMSARINYQMLSSMSDEKFDGKNKMADMYCDGDACEIKTESMSAQ